jgi:hypothetical protein
MKWIKFLAFCHKYDIRHGRREAINNIGTQFQLRQAHRLRLAHLYDINEWKGPAIHELLTMPNNSFEARDYEDLGPGLMFAIQSIRQRVLDHNLWLQLKVLPLVHAVGCSMGPSCGQDWDASYRATVLWLIHPNPRFRKCGEEVRGMFADLQLPSMPRACREATISNALANDGFTRDAAIIDSGMVEIMKLVSN